MVLVSLLEPSFILCFFFFFGVFFSTTTCCAIYAHQHLQPRHNVPVKMEPEGSRRHSAGCPEANLGRFDLGSLGTLNNRQSPRGNIIDNTAKTMATHALIVKVIGTDDYVVVQRVPRLRNSNATFNTSGKKKMVFHGRHLRLGDAFHMLDIWFTLSAIMAQQFGETSPRFDYATPGSSLRPYRRL